MAEENDNSQEKTEEATPRRLEKAREDGQTARSKELATMAVLLAGAGGLLMFGFNRGKDPSTVFIYLFAKLLNQIGADHL